MNRSQTSVYLLVAISWTEWLFSWLYVVSHKCILSSPRGCLPLIPLQRCGGLLLVIGDVEAGLLQENAGCNSRVSLCTCMAPRAASGMFCERWETERKLTCLLCHLLQPSFPAPSALRFTIPWLCVLQLTQLLPEDTLHVYLCFTLNVIPQELSVLSFETQFLIDQELVK